MVLFLFFFFFCVVFVVSVFAFLLARGDRPAARCASPAYIIETSK